MTEQTPAPNTEGRTWLTEGILIAAVPAVAYGMAFTYEYGFASYFHIPVTLIEVGLSNVFIALGYLLSAIFAMYVLAELVNPFWGKLPAPVRARLRVYIGYTFMVVIVVVLGRASLKELGFLLIPFAVFALFDFGIPAIPQAGTTYLERVQRGHQADLSYDSVMDKVGKTLGPLFMLTFLVLWGIFYASHTAGKGSARWQKEFWVAPLESRVVLLRRYGDVFVLAPFSETAKEITPDFTLFRMGPGSSLQLRRESIGPLSVADEKEKKPKEAGR